MNNKIYNPYDSLEIEDLPNEEWRVIEGFQKFYHISNFGRIKSLKNNKVTILKTTHHSHRALRLKLTNISGIKNYHVHMLMGIAFFKGNRVKHKDGNWKNNSVDNLEMI